MSKFGIICLLFLAFTIGNISLKAQSKVAELPMKFRDGEPVVAKNVNPAFKDYVGQYGDRTISDDGENLYIQRPNGMKLKLVELSKDEFKPEIVPDARIKFIRDENGKITEINVLNPLGTREKAKKS